MINELSLLDTLLGTTAYTVTPDVDIIENKDNYVIEMDLPGLTQEDVQISLDNNTLTIKSAEKTSKTENKEETNAQKTTYLIRERRRYSFERSFALPRDTDNANITARFANGVLSITIARKAKAQPVHITIQAA